MRMALLLALAALSGRASSPDPDLAPHHTCGVPTGVWHDWCDVSRSAPITVAAAKDAGAASRCPGGVHGGAVAFDVSGHAPDALLCALKNKSYWLSSFVAGAPAVGTANRTTCASIEWQPDSTIGDGSLGLSGSSGGWCRLPRSTACPPCTNPHPSPSPSPPAPGPPPAPPAPPAPPGPPAPPPAPAKTPTVLAFYMGDVGAPTYWIDYDWSILTHIVLYGSNDPNMISYAKARNVKLLQTYNGCINKDLSNSSVRTRVLDSVRECSRTLALTQSLCE